MKPKVCFSDMSAGIDSQEREMTDEEYAVYLEMVENANPLPITDSPSA